MDNNILEIFKETCSIDNLLSSNKLSQKQIDELNIKLNERFSKNEFKKLNKTLFKLNEILKDKTDKILQNMD